MMPPDMRRIALLLEYDGAGFFGWQRQADGITVQSVLEHAAGRLTNGPMVACTAAGRTDSGVHAEGQVVHLDLPRTLEPPVIRDALNYHMKPHRAAVLQATEVPPSFSARFSATGRAYRYVIHTRKARLVLAHGRAWHVDHPLDLAAMTAAAGLLVGHHDFTSFRAASCQARSPMRTLERLDVTQTGEVTTIVAEARSFLHHQVRNIVGTLKLVGAGKWRPEQVAEALDAKHRKAAGPTAPPEGLTLTNVEYTDEIFKRQKAVLL